MALRNIAPKSFSPPTPTPVNRRKVRVEIARRLRGHVQQRAIGKNLKGSTRRSRASLSHTALSAVSSAPGRFCFTGAGELRTAPDRRFKITRTIGKGNFAATWAPGRCQPSQVRPCTRPASENGSPRAVAAAADCHSSPLREAPTPKLASSVMAAIEKPVFFSASRGHVDDMRSAETLAALSMIAAKSSSLRRAIDGHRLIQCTPSQLPAGAAAPPK